MATTCEVIGWLMDGTDKGHVLVRESDGHISTQTTSREDAFGRLVMQTGSFRFGNPIIDPVTREMLGYEMERLSHPLVTSG